MTFSHRCITQIFFLTGINSWEDRDQLDWLRGYVQIVSGPIPMQEVLGEKENMSFNLDLYYKILYFFVLNNNKLSNIKDYRIDLCYCLFIYTFYQLKKKKKIKMIKNRLKVTSLGTKV